jgi:hypothetical protein
MEPDARRRNSDICPSRRLRTVSLGNKGRFWCTPSTVEIAGAKRSERKGHAGGDAAEQSHQIGGKDVLRGFPP